MTTPELRGVACPNSAAVPKRLPAALPTHVQQSVEGRARPHAEPEVVVAEQRMLAAAAVVGVGEGVAWLQRSRCASRDTWMYSVDGATGAGGGAETGPRTKGAPLPILHASHGLGVVGEAGGGDLGRVHSVKTVATWSCWTTSIATACGRGCGSTNGLQALKRRRMGWTVSWMKWHWSLSYRASNGALGYCVMCRVAVADLQLLPLVVG